jgi:hypothetical protein
MVELLAGNVTEASIVDVDVSAGTPAVSFAGVCGPRDSSALHGSLRYDVKQWIVGNASWDMSQPLAVERLDNVTRVLASALMASNQTVFLSDAAVQHGNTVCAAVSCVDEFGRQSAASLSDCVVVDMLPPSVYPAAEQSIYQSSLTSLLIEWSSDVDGQVLSPTSLTTKNMTGRTLEFHVKVFTRNMPNTSLAEDQSVFPLCTATSDGRVALPSVDLAVLKCENPALSGGPPGSPQYDPSFCYFNRTCEAVSFDWVPSRDCAVVEVTFTMSLNAMPACYFNGTSGTTALSDEVKTVAVNETVLYDTTLMVSRVSHASALTSSCCAALPYGVTHTGDFDTVVQSGIVAYGGGSTLLATGTARSASTTYDYVVLASTVALGDWVVLSDDRSTVLDELTAPAGFVPAAVDSAAGIVVLASASRVMVCWRLLHSCDTVPLSDIVTLTAAEAPAPALRSTDDLVLGAVDITTAAAGAWAVDAAVQPTIAVVVANRTISGSSVVTLRCTAVTLTDGVPSGCSAWRAVVVAQFLASVASVDIDGRTGVLAVVSADIVYAFDTACGASKAIDLVTICPSCHCVTAGSSVAAVLAASLSSVASPRSLTLTVSCLAVAPQSQSQTQSQTVPPRRLAIDAVNLQDRVLGTSFPTCAVPTGLVTVAPSRHCNVSLSTTPTMRVIARSGPVDSLTLPPVVVAGPVVGDAYTVITLPRNATDVLCRAVATVSAPRSLPSSGSVQVTLGSQQLLVSVPSTATTRGAVFASAFCERGYAVVGGASSGHAPVCRPCADDESSFGGLSRVCEACDDAYCATSNQFSRTLEGLSLPDGTRLQYSVFARGAYDGTSAAMSSAPVLLDATPPTPNVVLDLLPATQDSTPGSQSANQLHPMAAQQSDESDYQVGRSVFFCSFMDGTDLQSGIKRNRM